MQNENVKIIANDQGNRTTPSCVSFSDDGRRIGDPAMNANAQNLYTPLIILWYFELTWHSVFNVKRLIGRKFNDPEVQSDIKYLPFTVFNKAGKPCIRLTYHGKEREFVRYVAVLRWMIWTIFVSVSWRNFFDDPSGDERDRRSSPR